MPILAMSALKVDALTRNDITNNIYASQSPNVVPQMSLEGALSILHIYTCVHDC